MLILLPGLLKEETTDTFVLVEEQKGRTHDVVMVDEDEAESAMASQHDQREEEMNVGQQIYMMVIRSF